MIKPRYYNKNSLPPFEISPLIKKMFAGISCDSPLLHIKPLIVYQQFSRASNTISHKKLSVKIRRSMNSIFMKLFSRCTFFTVCETCSHLQVVRSLHLKLPPTISYFSFPFKIRKYTFHKQIHLKLSR